MALDLIGVSCSLLSSWECRVLGIQNTSNRRDCFVLAPGDFFLCSLQIWGESGCDPKLVICEFQISLRSASGPMEWWWGRGILFYLFIYLDPEWRELNTRPLGITRHPWGWGMPREIILLLACHFPTTFVRVHSGSSISCSLLAVCWDPPGVWLPVTATEFCSYWQRWQWPRSLNFERLCKYDGTGTCLYGYCLGLTLSTWIWF